MERRRKIFVNEEEESAYLLLEKALKNRNARVFPKVRIADALLIEKSGLSIEEYSYALKGHFDYLVEPKGQAVAFAIEFDEPYHDTENRARHNDKLKNTICEKLGLPLLRIQIDQFQQIGKYTILGWLVELWFLYNSFIETQEKGAVPPDELFDYSAFLTSTDSDGRTEWYPFDPFTHYRRLFYDLTESDEAFNCCVIRCKTDQGYEESISAIYLTTGGTILGKGRCRTFSYPPVSAVELAEELAVRDVYIKYWQYKYGRYVTVPHAKADLILREYRNKHKTYGGLSVSKTKGPN